MKIERISENAIKFTLSIEDIEKQKLNVDRLNPLYYNSSEMKETIYSMLDEACEKFGIVFEDPGYIKMDMRTSTTGELVIVLTIIRDKNELSSSSPFYGNSELEKAYGFNPFVNDGLSSKTKTGKKTDSAGTKKKNNINSGNIMFYTFNNLDELITAARILDNEKFRFTSEVVYKKGNKFILVLKSTKAGIFDADIALCEYGKRMDVKDLYEAVLKEHEEVFIKKNAIEILNKFA